VKRIIFLLLLIILGCSKREIPEWKLGQWVTYTYDGKEVKYSITGQEGKDFWIEVERDTEIVKVLVSQKKAIEKMVVRNGNEKQFTFTDFMIISKSVEFKKKNVQVIYDKISLPSRDIRILKMGTIWFSYQVPIFGIVKYHNLILKDFGYSNKQG
jgi:hypothetical protein